MCVEVGKTKREEGVCDPFLTLRHTCIDAPRLRHSSSGVVVVVFVRRQASSFVVVVSRRRPSAVGLRSWIVVMRRRSFCRFCSPFQTRDLRVETVVEPEQQKLLVHITTALCAEVAQMGTSFPPVLCIGTQGTDTASRSSPPATPRQTPLTLIHP